jgi:branched-subunit amino acid transport protein
MNEAIIIIGMAIVTLAARYPLLALLGRLPNPERIMRPLRYVPPAVLTAIIVPAMLFKDGRAEVSLANDYLVAGLISALIAWRSKNLLLTIVLGMVFLLAWRWLIAQHVLGF